MKTQVTKNFIIRTNCEDKNEQKKVSYNGNIDDYYMVDYFDVDECRWIRSPFNTLDDIHYISSIIKIEGKEVQRFRVLPEKWLSELRDNTWNEETNSYEKDVITNRTNLFGDRYDAIAEGITGVKSLNKIW